MDQSESDEEAYEPRRAVIRHYEDINQENDDTEPEHRQQRYFSDDNPTEVTKQTLFSQSIDGKT